MKTITWKFEGRRKAEEFVLYKPDTNGNVVFQSDRSIGIVNLETGSGKLYLGKKLGAYFHHLLFGTPQQFPVEFVKLITDNSPKSGDVISENPSIVWS